MKNFFENIYYFIIRSWDSFTWSIKRFLHSIRIYFRIKYALVASWECVDTIVEVPMELFCDFYEEEFIKTKGVVEWDSDEEHQNAKAIMDELYQYWTIDRPVLINDIEEIESLHSKEMVVNWIPIENEMYKIDVVTTKFGDRLRKLLIDFENEKIQKDSDCLRKLAGIRGHLWT